MRFNSNEDLRQFSRKLTAKLEVLGEMKLAHELKDWEQTFYTTSSEMLGELRDKLDSIKSIKTLDQYMLDYIRESIRAIDEAFLRSASYPHRD